MNIMRDTVVYDVIVLPIDYLLICLFKCRHIGADSQSEDLR